MSNQQPPPPPVYCSIKKTTIGSSGKIKCADCKKNLLASDAAYIITKLQPAPGNDPQQQKVYYSLHLRKLCCGSCKLTQMNQKNCRYCTPDCWKCIDAIKKGLPRPHDECHPRNWIYHPWGEECSDQQTDVLSECLLEEL